MGGSAARKHSPVVLNPFRTLRETDIVNVLALNLGSSSLKFSAYRDRAAAPERVFDKEMPATGGPASAALAEKAIGEALGCMQEIHAVGYRVVFGGEDDAPAIVSPHLLARLEDLQSLDPLHLPGVISLIRSAQNLLPNATHAALFDTAFFHDVPSAARVLPLPAHDALVRRFGFHGLSYASAVHALGEVLAHRTIVAHLGNGTSAAALLDGSPVDTTMGFSPLGGIVMSTRPGDVDPGALLYMLERESITVSRLRKMLEEESGLRAISCGESDILKLTARTDSRAMLAVETFVRSAAKAIAGLATVLGGMDMLVFTGGIGEHNTAVREAITARISFLNPDADIRIVRSDENGVIARQTLELARAATVY